MGTWNTEHFDNDTAMDWIYDFSLAPYESTLEAAFTQVLNSKDFIDADDGAIALAAAEVIAAAKGKTGSSWPEDIDIPNDLRIPAAMVAQALQAIDAVAGSDTSELKELWMESNDYEGWQAAVDDLKTRLQ
jgi:Domain of unknown function (DUF4259)